MGSDSFYIVLNEACKRAEGRRKGALEFAFKSPYSIIPSLQYSNREDTPQCC